MSKVFWKKVILYDTTTENNPFDSTWHGTDMTLLIGSKSRMKNSIYGIKPNAKIYSIKVCYTFGITNSEYLHFALEYELSIINISLNEKTYNNEISNDIKELKGNNVLIFWSDNNFYLTKRSGHLMLQ